MYKTNKKKWNESHEEGDPRDGLPQYTRTTLNSEEEKKTQPSLSILKALIYWRSKMKFEERKRGPAKVEDTLF